MDSFTATDKLYAYMLNVMSNQAAAAQWAYDHNDATNWSQALRIMAETSDILKAMSDIPASSVDRIAWRLFADQTISYTQAKCELLEAIKYYVDLRIEQGFRAHASLTR